MREEADDTARTRTKANILAEGRIDISQSMPTLPSASAATKEMHRIQCAAPKILGEILDTFALTQRSPLRFNEKTSG